MSKKKHHRIKQCRVCAATALAEEVMLRKGGVVMILLPWSPGEDPTPFTGDPETLPLVPCFDAARSQFPDNICRHGLRVVIRGPGETCRQVIEAMIAEARRTLTDPVLIQTAEAYRFMVMPVDCSEAKKICVRPDTKILH